MCSINGRRRRRTGSLPKHVGRVMDTDRQRADERAIERLLYRWAHARDFDDWSALADCFHDGATIHIAAISGTARDYVAQSRTLAARRTPGATSKHIVSAPLIEVCDDRAFSICHATLYIRRMVGGVEVDIESFMRFFDLIERRAERWAIVKRTGVYEKDRISAVDPAGFPAGLGRHRSRAIPAQQALPELCAGQERGSRHKEFHQRSLRRGSGAI